MTLTPAASWARDRTGVRQLMSDLRSWHRWLAMEGDSRPFGKAIAGWSNVLFLFLVASGLYLWFPRRWHWQSLRAVTLFIVVLSAAFVASAAGGATLSPAFAQGTSLQSGGPRGADPARSSRRRPAHCRLPQPAEAMGGRLASSIA